MKVLITLFVLLAVLSGIFIFNKLLGLYYIFLKIFSGQSLAAEYAGYAGPGVYGPISQGSVAILGSTGHKVKYCITEVTGDTQICCEGSNGVGTFQSIGCFTSHSTGCGFALDWGNNANTPKIRCKGTVLGSTFKWSV